MQKAAAETAKIKADREYELEKLRIERSQNINNTELSTSRVESRNVHSEFRKLMHEYNVKDGDINFYLIIFERQAKRMGIKEEDWVSHLIGLLPYEITQLIARENEENANDYAYIKSLLLKRYKLSSDKFRVKFLNHVKSSEGSWKDFAFELMSYCTEWIAGVGVADFDSLKNLIVTEQMKKRVNTITRDHFIDEWSKINNPDELADKLDSYDSVRFKNSIKYENAVNHNSRYDKSKVEKKFIPGIDNKDKKRPIGSSIRNEKGQFKCFNCNFYGHISKDCPQPKAAIYCTKCNKQGHTYRTCKFDANRKEESNNLSVSQSISNSDATMAPTNYLKDAFIYGHKVSALVDTGSSSCLLKESIASKLDLDVQPDRSKLFGFGNQNTPVSRAIGRAVVNIRVDDVVGKSITLLIVKDDTQPCDLILGRTWIDLPYIAFARVGSNLRFGYADSDLLSRIQVDLNKNKIKLKTTEKTELVGNSINLIKASTNEIDNGLILVKSIGQDFDTILEVTKGETIVPVVNAEKFKIKIEQNQCLGRGMEIKEESMGLSKDIEVKNKQDSEKEIPVVVTHENPIMIDEIKFDKSLSTEKREELNRLINSYRDCFALNISELGCTNVIKMDIKEYDGSKPVFQKPYKTNSEERQKIKEIVSDWKRNGIVTETRSPYSSPVLLVKKKTGEERLVIDYRKLNAQTVKDKFPLPKIDDILECIGDSKYFTTLDLASGYLQIPLTDEAKLKTAFITPDDTGQFERMIFGLANAPAEFQRLMNSVLGPLFNRRVMCYLDDILIPARTWPEMIEKLREVFECLRKAKLTLKLPKCEFGKLQVEFLGFIISSDGLQPGPRKIAAIEDFPVPKNVHDVRRFLGLTSFFRRFVPKYSHKARPLSELTKKNENFVWGAKQSEAFEELKENLVKSPILAHYNPDLETEVHCDASSVGLAGILLQREIGKEWRIVYCVSKKTTDTEQNYHSSKLELMAIVWTLDRLRQFLIGIKFTIVTDCQAIVYLNAKKSSNPQMARWFNLMQEYDFEIRHRSGERMKHVDALSRAAIEEPEDTLDALIERKFEVYLTLTEDEQVLMIQHADPELKELIEIFQKDEDQRTKEDKQKISNYVFKRNRLFRRIKDKRKDKLLYVIPKSMRKSMAVKFHDLMGHFSVERTAGKIKELYWFPYMKRYLRRHIAMCFECLVNKVPGGKQQGFLHPIKPAKRPFSLIHLDHLGPFVRSSRGNQHLLVLIDNFTRFTRLTPVKSTSAQHVLKALKNFVDEFGLPDRIISDRGSCFTSRQFESYCQENGIHHTLTSTQHPQGNGMVERVNRTIIPTIATSMEDHRHKDWDLKIKEVERNLNNVVNKTTDKTPFEMLHGYSPRFHDGILRRVADEDAQVWTDPKEIQKETRDLIEEKQEKIKTAYDKKKCRTLKFEPGEIVVVRRPSKQTGEPTKTQAKYRGPLIVTEVLPSDTYRVTQLEEKQKGHFYTTTAHVSQLKPWKLCHDSSDSEHSGSSDSEH